MEEKWYLVEERMHQVISGMINDDYLTERMAQSKIHVSNVPIWEHLEDVDKHYYHGSLLSLTKEHVNNDEEAIYFLTDDVFVEDAYEDFNWNVFSYSAIPIEGVELSRMSKVLELYNDYQHMFHRSAKSDAKMEAKVKTRYPDVESKQIVNQSLYDIQML